VVIDETMVFWTGLGPVHLTYIPLGVMFKGITQGRGGTCWVCGKKSQWKCACGRAVCGPSTRARVRGGVKPPARLCWKGHMDAVNAGVEAHTLPYLFRKGRRPKL